MTTTALPKGRRTRDAVLTRGVELACRVGLGGLTIGGLADEVGMSKSGMYAHFGSKVALQLAVLDAAANDFATRVVVPALRAPRGEPRVRALAEGWITCGVERQPGGCLFVKASTELDEQDGPVRDRLREMHRQLADSIARIVAGGVSDGQFHPATDTAQFATDLHGVMLAMYHAYRLLDDPAAERHARTAIERLLAAARTPPHGTAPDVAAPVAPDGTAPVASDGTAPVASDGTAPGGTAPGAAAPTPA